MNMSGKRSHSLIKLPLMCLFLMLLICYVQESYVRSDEFGRDLSSVQTLLTKQETFDIGLDAFENEGKFILCQVDINYVLMDFSWTYP